MARMQKPAWAIEVGGHNYGLNLFWVGVKKVRSDRDEPFNTIEDDSDARVALELGMVVSDPLDLLIAAEEGLAQEMQDELRPGSVTLGEWMGDAIDYLFDSIEPDEFDDASLQLAKDTVGPEAPSVCGGTIANPRLSWGEQKCRLDSERGKETNHRQKVCRRPKSQTLTIRHMVATI